MAASRLLAGAAAAGAFLALTGDRVPNVPWRSPGNLVTWADHVGPGLAGMAVVHAALAVGAGFAVLLGALHLLAALLPGRHGARAAAVTGRLTPAILRAGLGMVVTATTATTVPAAVASADTIDPPHRAADPPDTRPDGAPATTTATMTHLGAVTAAPLPPPAADAPPEGAAPDRWVVTPGEHLWGIAEETLADRLGRPPTDAEVVPYWRTVIEANRDRLVHRDDPDLILPGQVLLLPPVGSVTLSPGTPVGS
jgi:hypothetical protein